MDWLSSLMSSFSAGDLLERLVHFLTEVGKHSKFGDFCLAVGAMIGTMIALVVTLSIIPIQRAVELLSPSVAAHYRKKGALVLIYFFLAAFCIISYSMAFANGGAVTSLVMMIVLISSLVLVFLHHRSVSKLLEPSSAIEYLWKVLRRDARHLSTEKLRTGGYADISVKFNRYSIELEAIARKTFDSGDLYSCLQTVWTIKDLTAAYLGRLEDEGLAAVGDVVQRTVGPTFHWLETLHRHCALGGSEETCSYIAGAFREIGYTLRELKSLPDESYNRVCHDLMVHLRICALEAQHNDLDSVAVKLSAVILDVSLLAAGRSAPDHVSPPSFAMAYWGLFVQNFVAKAKFYEAESILEHMMKLLDVLMKRGHEDFYHAFHSVLTSLNAFVQASHREESTFNRPTAAWVPRAYSTYLADSPSTLSGLIRQAVLLENKSRSPLSVSDSPLQNLGMFLLSHINELTKSLGAQRRPIWHSIRQIVKCLLESFLEVIRTCDASSVPRDEVVQQLPQIIDLFPKCVERDYEYVECLMSACDDLAYAGISYFQEGLHPLADHCARAILAVEKSYTGWSSYSMEEAAKLLYFISYIERGTDCASAEGKPWAPKISLWLSDTDIPPPVYMQVIEWRTTHGPEFENLEFDYSLVDAGGPENKNRAVKLLREMFGTAQ